MESKQISDNDILDVICLFQDAIDIITNQDEERVTFAESDSISVPSYMKSAAKRGLNLREKQTDSNKCCTPTGIARARQLSNKENLTISTIKRIKSFAARHASDLGSAEKDSKKVQALLMWGVPATSSGVDKVIKWCDRQIARYDKQKEKK